MSTRPSRLYPPAEMTVPPCPRSVLPIACQAKAIQKTTMNANRLQCRLMRSLPSPGLGQAAELRRYAAAILGFPDRQAQGASHGEGGSRSPGIESAISSPTAVAFRTSGEQDAERAPTGTRGPHRAP